MTTRKQAQSSSGWRAWRRHCRLSLPKELDSQTGTTALPRVKQGVGGWVT